MDATSGEAVYPADIWLAEAKLHTMTDRDGRFAFQNVPAGSYTLRATRIGYEVFVREAVLVEAGAPFEIELSMARRELRLETITVTPGAYSFMSSNTNTHQTMSREDIESVPLGGEDVFRAVNRLPGLSSGDYGAHFSIRGGRHDETLILLDGLELYEPYHLKDFNEGALSIVDVETIDGVQLMTGGFPAQYGNKRSGVFDISSRTPETDKTRYGLGISMMNARAMARGPLWNGKATWLLSARSGYMDLVFGLINKDELPSPRYHDIFGKFQVQLSDHNKLTLDILHAGDTYKFDAPSTTGYLDSLQTRENANNRYGNSYAWTTLQSTLGAKTAVKTMLSAGLVKRSRDGYEAYVFNPAPLYTLTNDRNFSILGLKQDWTHGIYDAWVLTEGFDVRRMASQDDNTVIVGVDPNDPTQVPSGTYPYTTQGSFGKVGSRVGVYLSNRIRPVSPLILELGGRYDYASYTDDNDFSPRASGALNIGGGRTLRLGWGYYRQMQGIDDVAALNNDNRYFRSELSIQTTAGIEQTLGDGGFLRIEAYVKDGSRLRPVYRNWKGGIDTFPETNEDRVLMTPQDAKSSGIEVYFDRKWGDRFATRAGYSYSRAREVVDAVTSVNVPWSVAFDAEHANPQDQRHAVNLDFNYKFKRTWGLNGALAYHSGWPATHEELVPVIDEDGEPDTSVRPTGLYAYRLPSYLRFDARATRRWSTSHGDFRFFVELVNMTNHENIFGYDYFRTPGPNGTPVLDKEDETWFTLLPSLGIYWSGSF